MERDDRHRVGALLGALSGGSAGVLAGHRMGRGGVQKVLEQVKTAPTSVAKSTAAGMIPGVNVVQAMRGIQESGGGTGRPFRDLVETVANPGRTALRTARANRGLRLDKLVKATVPTTLGANLIDEVLHSYPLARARKGMAQIRVKHAKGKAGLLMAGMAALGMLGGGVGGAKMLGSAGE